ncbi:MAG TPA: hypothetical protein VKJ07_25335 [Mycobacteriales bacterium]|nr:hypothetical protein [Mycobacteriales bacterium]
MRVVAKVHYLRVLVKRRSREFLGIFVVDVDGDRPNVVPRLAHLETT